MKRVTRFTLDIEWDDEIDPAGDMWMGNEIGHVLDLYNNRDTRVDDPFNVSLTTTDVTGMTEREAGAAVIEDRMKRGIGIEIADRKPGAPTRRYREDNPEK